MRDESVDDGVSMTPCNFWNPHTVRRCPLPTSFKLLSSFEMWLFVSTLLMIFYDSVNESRYRCLLRITYCNP